MHRSHYSYWDRGILLLAVFLASVFGCVHEPQSPLDKAAGYLWSQQGADGGWHSAIHGILKGGEALTPFILWQLLNTESTMGEVPAYRVEGGLQFLRRCIAAADEEVPLVLEYPNYAAAYALRVFHHFGRPADSVFVHSLTGHLLSEQFTEQRGIDVDHPAYGGWGFGETGLPWGKAGHVDISHSRRIAQALAEVLPEDHEALANARIYFQRHQNYHPCRLVPQNDGGFFTSMHTGFTNKSLQYSVSPDRWESYATATCDGLLGLLASGYHPTETSVQAAAHWLLDHPRLDYPEGIPLEDPAQWHRVMQYYHLAVRAEAYVAVGYFDHWQSEAMDILSFAQRADGSFVNPMGGPNKEDDPLLATTFALITMQVIEAAP